MPTVSLSYGYESAARDWTREFPSLDLDMFLTGALMIRIGRIIESDLSSLCQKNFALSGQEMGLLFALRRMGHPYRARPRDLTRMLLITSGAVTKQIDRLAAARFVAREPDESSRNGQQVGLTAEGIGLVDRATALLAEQSIITEAGAAVEPGLRTAGEEFCRQLVSGLEETAKRRSNGVRRAPVGRRTST